MAPRRDQHTLDLLGWEPPSIVPQFEACQVKAPTPRDRIARAVAVVLVEAEMPRKEIARRMSAWMGEDISLHMLNAYASQAKDHTISANRLAALSKVTGDTRALQLLADEIGCAVVRKKYVSAIEDAMIADQISQLKAQQTVKRRDWKS